MPRPADAALQPKEARPARPEMRQRRPCQRHGTTSAPPTYALRHPPEPSQPPAGDRQASSCSSGGQHPIPPYLIYETIQYDRHWGVLDRGTFHGVPATHRMPAKQDGHEPLRPFIARPDALHEPGHLQNAFLPSMNSASQPLHIQHFFIRKAEHAFHLTVCQIPASQKCEFPPLGKAGRKEAILTHPSASFLSEKRGFPLTF